MAQRDALIQRVRAAHADAWHAEGLLREPFGGGATQVRGARLMASGIRTPKWNNADIVGSDVDVAAMIEWYAARDVPWGVRVPLELSFELGQHLFEKRCAGLVPSDFVPSSPVAGISIRRATTADLRDYSNLELTAFGGDAEMQERWVKPALGAPGFVHWLASDAAGPVGVAATVLTDETAGPAAYLSGVCAVPRWRRRGVEPLLAATAAVAAFDWGATLIHMNPDDDERSWARALGFVEVPGFIVRLVRAG